MFDHIPAIAASALMPHPDPLHAFVENHGDALVDGAAVLAGRGGARLARAVVDGLRDEPAPSRRLRRELDDLLDILSLEHVHDQSRQEAERFMIIDPASPCVEELCLLADGLRDAVEASRFFDVRAELRVDERTAA